MFSARALSVVGPTLWNLLPAHLRVTKKYFLSPLHPGSLMTTMLIPLYSSLEFDKDG